jgi:hypothetical protein
MDRAPFGSERGMPDHVRIEGYPLLPGILAKSVEVAEKNGDSASSFAKSEKECASY